MPRKISREDSLDRAITLFWDNGFRGTSMDMLTSALGVEKPSIYSNFGSKKDLYLEALDHYQAMLMSRIETSLERGANAREGLDLLMIELMAPNNARIRRGCLATNAVLEMAKADPDISARIKQTFDDLFGLMTQSVRRGQRDGSIRDDRPAGALAQFLVSCFEGVRVLEKTSAEMPHWQEAARLALAALDPPTKTLTRGSNRKAARPAAMAKRS